MINDVLKQMHLYTYNGPVMSFNTCICNRWKGSTHATSEKKARSNLMYQFKIENDRTNNYKVSLPGKITKEMI